MPTALREDLLNPIAGPNPGGESLRYNPVYDKIKEARREDDDAPQGEWKRERKTADFNIVIKLAGDALAEKSKDLQLAAWLTEALLRKDGLSGLRRGLDLNYALLTRFWDNLYPEIEDGDVEMRAAPLDWVGSYLESALKNAPFTKTGLGFFKYKESRTTGYEDQANENESRRQARATAISEGKISAEDFDKAIELTPTTSYKAWMEDLDACLATLETLNDVCNEKFGDYGPSFSKLRGALEEVHNVVKNIYNKRVEAEAPPPVEEAAPEPEPEPVAYSDGTAAAPARVVARPKVSGMEPADPAEAALRLAAIAKFLRKADYYDPAPYLMLRGYRWGETRRQGATPNSSFLTAPSTEVRQTIRRLASEANWEQLIDAAETAMAEPCGRGWMDLQRYVVKALDEWGCPGISAAIRSEIKALLTDIPEISNWTFDDDTPVANSETQAWLHEICGPAPAPARDSIPTYQPAAVESDPEGSPDIYTLAMQKMRSGRANEAIEMLAQDVALQSSGRGRFTRKVQLAELCLAAGREALILPILEEVVETIDHHHLDIWEAPDTVAHALTLLYRCLDKTHGDAAVKQKIYSRICRLDPMQALTFAR